MVKQGFHIGNRNWWVMVYYDVCPSNLEEITDVLIGIGIDIDQLQYSLDNLKHENTGLTLTNYEDHTTVIVISCATSAEQMFDSILHEVKHLVEHISSYYNLDPKEELAAYLQGEVGRQIFPAASLVLCPEHYCNKK